MGWDGMASRSCSGWAGSPCVNTMDEPYTASSIPPPVLYINRADPQVFVSTRLVFFLALPSHFNFTLRVNGQARLYIITHRPPSDLIQPCLASTCLSCLDLSTYLPPYLVLSGSGFAVV